jgi:hypothetical protein
LPSDDIYWVKPIDFEQFLRFFSPDDSPKQVKEKLKEYAEKYCVPLLKVLWGEIKRIVPRIKIYD